MIRNAKKEDIFELTKMAMAMHKESDFNDVPFNFRFTYDFLSFTLEDEDCCVFVLEKEGQIVGAFLGGVTPFFFSSKLKAYDTALFVLPEHRGGSAALKLLRQFETWAIEKGALKIYVSVSTNNSKADVFYDKMGYKRLGGVFRKNQEEVL